MNKSTNILPFKVGDVVKLPSEAKLMTVVSVENDKVQCVWLNHELSAQYHDFEATVLVLATTAQGNETPLDRSLMEN